MANWITDRVRTIRNLGVGGALSSRFRRSNPKALQASTNYYGPSNMYAGNTLSDYWSGGSAPEGSVLVSSMKDNQPTSMSVRKNNNWMFPVNPNGSPAAGQTNSALDSTGGTGGAGGSGGTDPLTGQWFNGTYFTDPAELMNAQRSYLDQIYGGQLGQLRSSRDSQLGAYGRQKNSILEALTQALGEYDTQEKKGLGGIGSYYSNLGDIYQSSQGVRENMFRGEVNTERGKTRKQADTQTSDLERAILDYTGQQDRSEQSLASQYQSALDDLLNQTTESILSKLALGQMPTGQTVQTGLTPGEVNAGVSMPQNIVNMRKGIYRNFGTGGGGNNYNAILQYLNGLR